MPEQLQKIVQPIKSRWDALARDQKIKLIAAVVIVLIAIGLTLYFLLRTEYIEMINGSEGAELMEVQAVLNEQGISSRLANNGTALEVDKNKIMDAKVAMETSTAISGETYTFSDALTSNDMGTTADVSRRTFVHAHESKLSEELTHFNDVNSADVTLIIPEAMRLFISDTEESRASVVLNVARELSRSEGNALAGHLAMSVEGLQMENIHITDQEYRVVYSGMEEEAARSVEGSIAEVKAMENSAVSTSIQSAFSRMFHDAVVIPNLVYDEVALLEETTERFMLPGNSEIGLPVKESSNSFVGENVSPDAAPGTDSNNAQQTTYATGNTGNSSFEQDESNVERVYDRVQTTRAHGPGSYLRDTSTLTVYLFLYRTHFQQKMMEDNPDFTEAMWADTMANTYGRNITTEYAGGIDTLLRDISTATGIPVGNISVAIWELPAFEPFAQTPIDVPLIIALSLLGLLLLMLAYALIRRQKLVEEEEEAEPELSVEDLLVSTQLEEAKEDAEKLEEIDYAKESEIKKQIEKFVNEKPEAVAALLRNWLNTEEW